MYPSIYLCSCQNYLHCKKNIEIIQINKIKWK